MGERDSRQEKQLYLLKLACRGSPCPGNNKDTPQDGASGLWMQRAAGRQRRRGALGMRRCWRETDGLMDGLEVGRASGDLAAVQRRRGDSLTRVTVAKKGGGRGLVGANN